MSEFESKAENICSQRVFRILTLIGHARTFSLFRFRQDQGRTRRDAKGVEVRRRRLLCVDIVRMEEVSHMRDDALQGRRRIESVNVPAKARPPLPVLLPCIHFMIS
jgi:hypothetical protein